MSCYATQALVTPEKIQEHLEPIVPFFMDAIALGSVDLTLHSLAVMKNAFVKGKTCFVAQDKSDELTEFLLAAMKFNQFKVITDSLHVCGRFVQQLRFTVETEFMDEKSPSVRKLYAVVLDYLKKGDADQQVKQSSINSMSNILTVAHGIFQQPEINAIVAIFGERLTGVNTRDAALKGFYKLATTPDDLAKPKLQQLGTLTTKFCDLLHQADR